MAELCLQRNENLWPLSLPISSPQVVSIVSIIALADPANRARYEAARTPGRSAYNMAVSEYMTKYDNFGNYLGTDKKAPNARSAKNSDTEDTVNTLNLAVETPEGIVIHKGTTGYNENLDWEFIIHKAGYLKVGSKITIRISLAGRTHTEPTPNL